MLGAVAGDMMGAPYEAAPIKTKAFPLFGAGSTFTDDSVCTVAIAERCLRAAISPPRSAPSFQLIPEEVTAASS